MQLYVASYMKAIISFVILERVLLLAQCTQRLQRTQETTQQTQLTTQGATAKMQK